MAVLLFRSMNANLTSNDGYFGLKRKEHLTVVVTWLNGGVGEIGLKASSRVVSGFLCKPRRVVSLSELRFSFLNNDKHYTPPLSWL